MRFAPFYLSRLRADRHFHHPKPMLKAAKNHFSKHFLAPKHVCFHSKVVIKRSNPSASICTCARHLPHITPRFGAFYPAFWCFLPHILLQKAWCGALDVYLNRGKRIFTHLYTHLVLPQTSWRNTRKNVGERRIGWKNRSHNVKFCAQNITSPLSVFSSTQHNFAVSKPCPCRPLKSKIRHREF